MTHPEFAQVESELLVRGFTRWVFDLSRIEELLDMLGSPQRAYPSIHLTGTNGKTSTARMIDSLLRAHGLRTGRFTSPHLETVRERVCLDGEPLDEERFVAAYREVAPVAELLDARNPETLTYFDLNTALAFAAFADAPVDVAIVEVGLGGAEDATNVLHAGVCVVTPVGLDHTEWLGDTVSDIAHAKAGIIHSGATVVAAAQAEDAARAIAQRCGEVGATLAQEGVDFEVRERAVAVGGQVLALQGLGGTYEEVFLPVHGAHQAQNAAVALAATEAFLGAGTGHQGAREDWLGPATSDSRPAALPSSAGQEGAREDWAGPAASGSRPAALPSPGGQQSAREDWAGPAASGKALNPELVREGFAGATIPGRLERVRTAPTILLDTAHNPHGMAATVAALEEEFSFRRLVAVVALFADKDAAGVLELLEPVADAVVVTRNSGSRAMPPARLGAVAAEVFGAERVTVSPELPDAIEAAVALAEADLDRGLGGVGILVTGSVVTVADARRLLRR